MQIHNRCVHHININILFPFYSYEKIRGGHRPTTTWDLPIARGLEGLEAPGDLEAPADQTRAQALTGVTASRAGVDHRTSTEARTSTAEERRAGEEDLARATRGEEGATEGAAAAGGTAATGGPRRGSPVMVPTSEDGETIGEFVQVTAECH